MILYPRTIRQRPADLRVPERAGPAGQIIVGDGNVMHVPPITGRLTLADLGPAHHERFIVTWLDGHGGFNWTTGHACPIRAELDFAERAARGQ